MSELAGRAALAAWRGVGRLIGPALGVMLDVRTRAGKEDPARRGERFGRASVARPEGEVVWMHAASVGETVSVLPLIGRLVAPGRTVVLTTGTVTSAKIAAERLPAGAIHQYVPLDVAPAIGRFLEHWRPKAALFVESEIWPATMVELAKRAIPQVLINGRMSPRSFSRWRRMPAVARAVFGRLTAALAQGEGDGSRLGALGVPTVSVTGNLKFDGAPLGADAEELARLAAAIGTRPRWLAASTHPGEETIAAKAHAIAARRLPGLLTVIAPRHPTRGDEIRAMLADRRLQVASRSRGEMPTGETDVYLCDTIGEMGLIYRLAPVAFVGGSLAPRGGQNPIEPARLGVAVVHGPSTHNFTEIYREFDEAGGAITVDDSGDLAAAIELLIGDAGRRGRLDAAARVVVERSTGALERTLAALAPLIEGGGGR